MLKVGDKAPDFTSKDQNGNTVSLKDLKGQRVVLYFYPKDDTPGCTKEACSFRDADDIYRHKGIKVLWRLDGRREVAHRNSYQVPTAIRPARRYRQAVVEAYGVWGEKSMYGRKYMGTNRKTFLIDENGKIVKTLTRSSEQIMPTRCWRRLVRSKFVTHLPLHRPCCSSLACSKATPPGYC